MSLDNADAGPPRAEHPRLFTSSVVVGIVCFGVGLLILAGGVLLVLLWLVTQDPASVIFGVLLALVGIGVNITGLVLLYRGATAPRPGAGNGSRNP